MLTVVTVLTARYVDLGEAGNLAVALLIAFFKAGLVVAFFMHLVGDKPINGVILLYCMLAFATFLMFTMIDLGSRGLVEPARAQTLSSPPMVFNARVNTPEVARGYELFRSSCAACHGAEGRGLPGLGKDMTVSEYIATTNDRDLLRFIKVGRLPGDPLNTTNVAMPARGGDPTLTDDKIREIIAFMRVLRPYTGDGAGGGDAHH